MRNTKQAPVFRVVWYANGNHNFEYIVASSAQEAVDIARAMFAPEGAEFVEVAKLLKGWK